jgi:hypothetical protein
MSSIDDAFISKQTWRTTSFVKQLTRVAVALTMVVSVLGLDASASILQRRQSANCLSANTREACTAMSGCAWWSGQCVVDAYCIMRNGACSQGCMLCGGFGCVAQARSCPTNCPIHRTPSECHGTASNGINCAWSEEAGTCHYYFLGHSLFIHDQVPEAIGGLLPVRVPPSQMAEWLASMTGQPTNGNGGSRSDGSLSDGKDRSNGRGSTNGEGRSDSGGQTTTPRPANAENTDSPRSGIDQPTPESKETTDTPTSDENKDGTNDDETSETDHGENNTTNESQDANTMHAVSEGSNKFWGAFFGIGIGLLAAAGIIFLVVQQRLHARREQLAEQRNAEMHDVQPRHTRESLLPFVQRALGVNPTTTS